MVYGEYIQNPQVKLATLLTSLLPNSLDAVYFLNSGSEAIEGAMKLAKRYTGRTEIISFKNAYHGSTQGSLSIMGSEEFKNAYRPLLPNIRHIEFNKIEDLQYISADTACVVVEMIQGEAGVVLPENDFLKHLRKRCTEVGALLVVDEIQTGFGRTGKLFAFEHYGILPDVLCIAKGMGGGMPISAFVSSQKIMSSLSNNPILGHITTFGGHPVSCAAAIANLQVILDENLISQVAHKEQLMRKCLEHPKLKPLKGKGLLLSLEFESYEQNKMVIDKCIQNGVITDWFVFNSYTMRIAPPLTITDTEIKQACAAIVKSAEEVL